MRSWVITGGIATGKSALASTLKRVCGPAIEHFSCDDSARRLWERPEIMEQVAGRLGKAVRESSGRHVDRHRVRDLVFADEKARKTLESILHPLILQELEAARRAAENSRRANVFVAEVPLYYEIGASIPADLVIVVAATRAVQRSRLMEHRKLDAATCDKMLDAQLPLETKIDKADMVVWNDGSPAILEAQALALLRDRWET